MGLGVRGLVGLGFTVGLVAFGGGAQPEADETCKCFVFVAHVHA